MTNLRPAFLRIAIFHPQIFVSQFFVSHFFVSQNFVPADLCLRKSLSTHFFVSQIFVYANLRLRKYSSAKLRPQIFVRKTSSSISLSCISSSTKLRLAFLRLCKTSSMQNFVRKSLSVNLYLQIFVHKSLSAFFVLIFFVRRYGYL